MNKCKGFSKMWLLLSLLVAFVAGCASNANEIQTIPDTVPPTVSFTSPANGETAVPVNRKISVAFSEAMNPATITTATFLLTGPGATPVSGTVAYVGTTATFTPASNLANSTLYTATITTGARDLAGNALATNYAWTFTTGSVADTILPNVSFTAPVNGETAVPVNRIINVAFSEAMDPLTITTASFRLTGPGATPVTGTVSYVGTTATFTPSGNLANSTLYTATITTGARDLAGNALATNYTWTFTTGAAADSTRPAVSFTAPVNGQTSVPVNRIINVAFSEAMDPLTITTTSFRLTGPGATPVTGTVAYVGTTATFMPARNLANSTLYTATITTGARDLAGNALATNYAWTFTTGAAADTTRPTVSFTSPANGAIAVPVNRIINVAFSEAMDPLTITTASFRLTGPGATPVTGTVAYVGTTATFTPGRNLANSTLYTATITTGARDLAGNALGANYVWIFTTGAAADTTRPAVSFTSPTNGAIAVPVNRIINVAFSEAMDPLSITTATFRLTGPGATPVTGTVAYVGTTATFTPSGNLANSTLYTGTITIDARDLAGNTLAANYVWTFTTSAAADTTAPTVITTVPLNLAAGVATNIVVTGTFNEAMNPLSISTATFSLKETVSNNNVPGAVTYSVNSNTATFTPLSNLLNNTNYTATIKGGITGAKDLAGNALVVDKVWSFTTGATPDLIRPTVILVNPLNLATNVALNSTVHATFSEDMDPLTISTATFSVAGKSGLVSYNAISRIATFTPSSNFAPSTTYTATISTGATDLAGNGLATDYVWSFTTGTGLAPGAVALGSAGAFGIMATSAITNTGASTMINGDVSLDPGTSNGLLPTQVNGTIHINDTVSALARADLLVAYNSAKGLPPGTTVPGGMDLGAFNPTAGGTPGTLPPGTYTSGSTMLVSTPLILDAGGNADAVWVFQIGSSLTTTNSVSLANGAQAKNVFWVPTSDATIGVGTIFYGTIVSGRDVTGQTGAVINGRILAGAILAGTIALDTNTVNVPAP